jgi:hypothetical protein
MYSKLLKRVFLAISGRNLAEKEYDKNNLKFNENKPVLISGVCIQIIYCTRGTKYAIFSFG